jgi:Protein of unknown function (DUF4254)
MTAYPVLPGAPSIVAEMERAVAGAPQTAPRGGSADPAGAPQTAAPGGTADPAGAPQTAARGGTADPAGAPRWATLIVDLVESNLRQWNLEDTTRDPAATDAEVARAKREIDRLNMGRHGLVQEIDAAIDSVLDQPATAPIATESPGMVLDRLSVLVIRRARTASASAQHPALSGRTEALESQVAGLSAALDFYMEELRAGTRRFLRYAPFKLYGPSPAAAASKE